MRFFAVETPDGLPDNLPVIGVQSMSAILRAFLTFFHLSSVFVRLSVPRMQRKFGFVLKTYPVGCTFCSKSIFHLLVPPRGYFFAIVCHTESFSSRDPSSEWSYTAATPHLRRLWTPGALETRTMRCLQRSFLHFYLPDPPNVYTLFQGHTIFLLYAGRITWFTYIFMNYFRQSVEDIFIFLHFFSSVSTHWA